MSDLRYPAHGLSLEQVQAGVAQGVYAEFVREPRGFVIVLKGGKFAYDGQVAAIVSWITGAPELGGLSPGLRPLADAYLTVRACFDAIPVVPPAPELDPWAAIRLDCKARMDATYKALVAAGGPV